MERLGRTIKSFKICLFSNGMKNFKIDQNNLLCYIAKNQVDAILLNIEEYCFEERRGNKLEKKEEEEYSWYFVLVR